MNWEAVTALSTAFTGVVILITALVGVTQLAQMRTQRRDAGAVELVRSLQDQDFSRSFELLMGLAPDISSRELHALGHDYVAALTIIAFRFETLGALVYRGTISFDVTEDLVGGAVVSIWQRLRTVAKETREAQGWPMYLEWFQWLAEQFERRGRLKKAPAHLSHRDWTPPARS